MNDELLPLLSRAAATQLALESLRSNDIPQTLELLELQLDVNVAALSRLAKDVPPVERERVTAMLREIRNYRRAHPRRVEADINSMASGLLVRAADLGGDRARKILEEIE
ncbi:MAG TPA: hypothetical protein VNX46_13230 [Candidatus Acidoferrum sp.]|jgi:hypothetical protein|nr:hypothetical protein [Candidatus Acidoferrum sp.]